MLDYLIERRWLYMSKNKINLLNKKNDSLSDRKILRSKRLIEEAKNKIKLEKQNIKKNKREEFKKTKFYKFFSNKFSFLKEDKDLYSFSEVLLITLVSIVIGAFACFTVLVILSGGRNYLKLSGELSKFVEVYDTIVENYNGDVDKDKLINEAIDGMVSSVGDVYTSYVGAEDTDEFNELVSGIYEGIGCTIQRQEEGVKVIEVFNDSPAMKAGLLVGDIILSVDGQDTGSMQTDEIANYIKTKTSEEIELVVLRDASEKDIIISRGKVETPVVNSTVYESNGKKVGYLAITMFTSGASKQFENKLKNLEKEGIDSLVIDVRGNNGGYLTTVTDIANLLLPKGNIIYQIQKDDNKKSSKDKTSTSRDYPIAILVNGASASASEILAAAIKESYGGFVVGTKTYGKGTVQQTKQLSDGSMIKYTIENWLTPDGNWIDGVGIVPTHEINLTEEFYNNPVLENDSQLQKAIELVSK